MENNTLKSTFTLENASKPTFEIDHSSKPAFVMEKILMCRPPLAWRIFLSPLCLCLKNYLRECKRRRRERQALTFPSWSWSRQLRSHSILRICHLWSWSRQLRLHSILRIRHCDPDLGSFAHTLFSDFATVILISAASLTLYSLNFSTVILILWFTLSQRSPVFAMIQIPAASPMANPQGCPILIIYPGNLRSWSRDPDLEEKSLTLIAPSHQNPDPGSFIHCLASKKSPLIVLNRVNPTFWSSQHMIPILTISLTLSRRFLSVILIPAASLIF